MKHGTFRVDVIEVEFITRKIRVIASNKTQENAEAFIKLAVVRRGVENSYFTTCNHQQFKNGDINK